MADSPQRRKMEPYLLAPYGSGTQASTGMGQYGMATTQTSDAAEGLVMGQGENEAGALKKLFGLRKITTFPSGKSLSYVATVDMNKSYKSFESIHNDRVKHYRPTPNPRDRFERDRPPLTSHEIGWFSQEKPLRKPTYPICSSAMTKFFDNMAQMSHMKKR